jgi:hypothetical protein
MMDLGLFPRLLILLQLFLTSREISKSYMSVLCDQAFTGSPGLQARRPAHLLLGWRMEAEDPRTHYLTTAHIIYLLKIINLYRNAT